MSVLHPYSVPCACGTTFTVHLADSLNAGRMPDARRQILEGEFHRFTCPNCGRRMTVEKQFSYVDFQRNTFIKVKPRQERHLWQDASLELEADLGKVPEALLAAEGRRQRVVFGLGELREKLIAEDAGLDDRLVELLKVFVIYEHPFLVQSARLRLQLDGVGSGGIDFVACYDHKDQRFRVRLPRPVADGMIEKGGELQAWNEARHPRAGLFSLDKDYWVNIWRWSPQTFALQYLSGFARDIRSRRRIDTNSSRFKLMLRYLPRGRHLPGWAKADLRTVFVYARDHNLGSLQDSLFELRFEIALEDDWAFNDDPDDIDTLWKLLADLPDTNVEGNTALNELFLAEGESGGWYEPWSHDIYIGAGSVSDREEFEDVTRHEIGHAVHEMYEPTVNAWLESRFGWRSFGTTTADIDAWVELMGGWGSLTSTERSQVRGYLITALGNGSSWTPGPRPNAPAGHPWWGSNFGPRLAYERTGANWYNNNANWYRSGGKAFFLNFWYQRFMAVDVATLNLINRGMPSRYAAMSPLEFFAEVYALHYDLDDPQRPNLPQDVVDWLSANIGAPQAGTPARPSLLPAHRGLAAARPRRRRARRSA